MKPTKELYYLPEFRLLLTFTDHNALFGASTGFNLTNISCSRLISATHPLQGFRSQYTVEFCLTPLPSRRLVLEEYE